MGVKNFYLYDPCYYILFLLLTSFAQNVSTSNTRNRPSCPFSALMTPLPIIAFINEKATGCINEEAMGDIKEAIIGAIITGRNPSFCFSISYFTVSLASLIKRYDFSSEPTILIVSSISSN